MTDLIDLHTHTIASGHAYNTLYEMAETAAKKGLELFGSSDHAPSMPGASHAFYFINFKVIPRNLFGIRLLMGCELNIMDYNGKVDLSPRYLKNLDYAIASLHDACYKAGSVEENTAACLGALNNPYIQIIGHPDDGRLPVDYEILVPAAKEAGKLLEVNSSSLHPLSPRMNSRENYITMLELCRRYQTPVIVSSDAHIREDIGNHEQALNLLKEIDFPEELVVNRSLEQLAQYLPKLKEYLELK